MKNRKKIFIIGFLLLGVTFAFKQAEDYFEISKNLDIFAAVYKEVNTSYVDDVKPGELIKEAIDAMLLSLDPYTNFYSEAQAEDYRLQVTGSYGGIGVSVRMKNGRIVVDQAYEGFPAQLNDLRVGDYIIEVDGKSVVNKNSKDLNELLKGTAGTPVKVKVDRPGIGEVSVDMERAQIKVKNVPYYGKIDEHTGYIKLTGFTPNAGKEVHDALVDLKTKDIRQVILDLRGNGGGLLHEAVNIVNVFVNRGEDVVQTKSKERADNRTYKTLNSPVDTEIPLIVLVDKGSASASEIVSGTIQDLDRGVVIGEKSFGKGLVQSSKSLTYNTQMKITTAKYYIPSGRCVQKLDYSHKKDGKAIVVADSLKHTFYTRNGRPVKDGEGVTPDIEVKRRDLSKIGQTLLSKELIFDFATQYRNTKDQIPEPAQFNVSDDDFRAFKDFLKGKDYAYLTDTEKALQHLEDRAESEAYLEALSGSLVQVKSQLEKNKDQDLERHRKEITELLELDIASRYYFDRALVETTFDDDPDIRESLALFTDRTRYASILKGSK
ncbi:MAG: S41 family peptidase [Flavobacteriales bacterium]|nr:S41 family peptidase [Flavobacteriales bacterium]